MGLPQARCLPQDQAQAGAQGNVLHGTLGQAGVLDKKAIK